MNPDRNVQLKVASLGELASTSPVRRLFFVVPMWKEVFYRLHSKSAASTREVTVQLSQVQQLTRQR